MKNWHTDNSNIKTQAMKTLPSPSNRFPNYFFLVHFSLVYLSSHLSAYSSIIHFWNFTSGLELCSKVELKFNPDHKPSPKPNSKRKKDNKISGIRKGELGRRIMEKLGYPFGGNVRGDRSPMIMRSWVVPLMEPTVSIWLKGFYTIRTIFGCQ